MKYGIYIFPSENKYAGLKNVQNLNVKEGYRIFYFLQDIRIKYKGEFKNNIREGYGIYYY